MLSIRKHRTALILIGWLFATQFAGCSDPEGPQIGSIRATIVITGADIDHDTDGYTITVDGGQAYHVGANIPLTIPDLPVGAHQVQLGGLAPNCSVNGSNPVTVEVDREVPTVVSFSVSCVPRTGSIKVTTTTSGPGNDPDGYLVTVGGETSSIQSSGTRNYSGLRDGLQTVRLTGVSTNCEVEGANPRPVNVVFGSSVDVLFAIKCTNNTVLAFTIRTTGSDIDPNGFILSVNFAGGGGIGFSVPSNGSVTKTAPSSGDFSLFVFELAVNCDPVIPSPRALAATIGIVTSITVEIVCVVPAQLAVVTGTENGGEEISVMNSNGSGLAQLTTASGSDINPAWSPDGSRIAFATARDGNFEIYVMNADGQNPVRLTNNSASERHPTWSPDGSRIAFQSDRDGNSEIYAMNADGSNPLRLTNNSGADADPAWSPDGARIAFESERGGTKSIWLMKPDGSDVTRLTDGNLADSQPAWSPDGARIAFSTLISPNNRNVYVINATGSGRIGLTQGFTDASEPAWSPDGGKIAVRGNYCYYEYYDCVYRIWFTDAKGTFYWTPAPVSVRELAWRP